MNEVSFRDSILDSIDTIVTESSNDVLFSLLDTADKAMMIMENCADTDDIWKYSIWQEADGNAEQIDKDKHPFKENSTLKTILMLPINLIKFIFKTISQAFSPQKTEEASKLQQIASAAPKVANKVAGWFINEDGEIRWPVVITTAGGGALTIDAIVQKIRGKDGLAVKFFKLIKDWISSHFGKLHKIAKKYNQNFPDSVSCDLKNDGDNPSYETNLNIEQADKYLKSCGEIFNTLDDKIKAIADAKDDSEKNKLSKELRAAIGKNLVLIPFVNSKQTYTLDQITNFYKTHSELLKQSFNQDTVSKFTSSYSTAIQSTKGAKETTGAQNKESRFASNIDTEAVNSVNVFMSAMSEVVIFIKNLQDGTNQINTVIADILKAAGVNNDSQITNIEEKGTAEQPETEIKKVEETPKPEDAAPDAQEPVEPTPEGQTDTNTAETSAEERPEQSSDENPVGTTSDSSEPTSEDEAKPEAGAESSESKITPDSVLTAQQVYDLLRKEGKTYFWDVVDGELYYYPNDEEEIPVDHMRIWLKNGSFKFGKSLNGDEFKGRMLRLHDDGKWYFDKENASDTSSVPMIKKGEHITAEQAKAAMEALGINVTDYKVENGVLVNPSGTKINGKLNLVKKGKTLDDSEGNKIRAIQRNTDDNTYSFVEYAVEDEEPIDPVVASWYNK